MSERPDRPVFEDVRQVVENQIHCPTCHAGRLTLHREYHAMPIGTYSVAGQQMKVSGAEMWIARCTACDTTFTVNEDMAPDA